MINIAICDDESVMAAYLAGVIRRWADARGVSARLSGYDSAESFLFAYEDDKDIDIILLDIQMKGMDGMELARRLRGDSETAQIIFVTAYPGYARDGYDVSALHYLVKPLDESKLFSVLDKALANLGKPAETFFIKTGGEKARIPLADILYAESFGHMTEIATLNGKFTARISAGELESAAGASFFRCHRSYLINLRHVRRVGKTELALCDGTVIPVSRRLYHALNVAFVGYHKGMRA